MCQLLVERLWSKEISIRQQTKVWLAKYWSYFILEYVTSNAGLVENGVPWFIFLCKPYLVKKTDTRRECVLVLAVWHADSTLLCLFRASYCANEVPTLQDVCGCQPVSKRMKAYQTDTWCHSKIGSSSFRSLLPGGSFCLICRQLLVSVLPVLFVALFIKCACSFLWLTHIMFCCSNNI